MYATVIPVWIGTGVLGSDVLGLHRLSACMLIFHKGHTDTIQVYSVTVLTHVKALQAGHSSQGTSEHITPGIIIHLGLRGPTPPGPTPFTINISPYQVLRYTHYEKCLSLHYPPPLPPPPNTIVLPKKYLAPPPPPITNPV